MIAIKALNNSKYKDELPSNTINNIQNILHELGIFTIQTNWKNSAEGFCSVSVKIPGTNLQTNGKGTTHEYALASGYAEIMERLQNQAQFRLSIDLRPKALDYKGFYYAPDERFLNIHDLINSKEDWIETQKQKIGSDAEIYRLMKKWRLMTHENIPADFVALPYFNINNNQISYIPVKMACKMYMSNGMCAGNTIEEALVQGLSEIFERHVNKEIIKKKISPPTIPHSYLNQIPRINIMINNLKSSGNYDVIIKDCSLGVKYPVVGVILINRDNQTYFIKFGAHPKLEIALERTLTELLQGQDIRNMMGLKEYLYKHDVNEEENLMSVLVNGSGYYPKEFFSSDFSYEFKGFTDTGISSNKEMLKYLIKLLKEEGYDVFVRDVSFLDFPSYHVVIPGFSEIEDIDDEESLDKYLEYCKIKKYIRNINEISNQKIQEILSHLEKYKGKGSIVNFLNQPVKRIFPWYYSNLHLYTGALYYKQGNYQEAYDAFDNYVKDIRMIKHNNAFNNMILTYYKCARDYIGAHMDNLDQHEITESLKVFYPSNVINGVIADLGNPEYVMKKYGQLECWNCEDCRLKGNCSYDLVENVYKRLKERYASKVINQKDLKKILEI